MRVLARGVLVLAVLWLPVGCGVGKLLELEAPGGTPALMTRVLIAKREADTRSSTPFRTGTSPIPRPTAR